MILLVLLISHVDGIRCAFATNRLSIALANRLLQHEANANEEMVPGTQAWLGFCSPVTTEQGNARKLGLITWLQGDFESALDIWGHAEIDVAAMYAVMGRYEDVNGFKATALTWYQRALELAPLNADYWNAYAMILRDEGDAEAALFAFSKAYELGSYDRVLQYVRILNAEKRYEESRDLLEQSLTAAPAHSDRLGWWQELIEAKTAQAMWQEVLTTTTLALVEHPEDVRLLTYYARAVEEVNGDRQAALDILEYAVSIDATNGQTLVVLGNMLVAEQEFETAGYWYGRAVELRPDHAYWRILQADAIFQTGDLEQTAILYKEAARLFPEHARISYNLAWVCYLQQDGTCAVQAIDNALMFKEGYIPLEWFYRAGLIHELAGNTTQAIERLQQALEIEQDYQPALEALERLTN